MNISGEYKVTLTIEKFGLPLRRYGVMKLQEESGQLKGSMFPLFYWLSSAFKGGKTEDNRFSFEVHFATPCQQYSMQVEGSVEEGVLTGTVHSPVGDYVMTGNTI